MIRHIIRTYYATVSALCGLFSKEAHATQVADETSDVTENEEKESKTVEIEHDIYSIY